jgi:hypothetical protein
MSPSALPVSGSGGRLLASFFCAVDGPVRVLIEADDEDDARCLCREMAFELIYSCD